MKQERKRTGTTPLLGRYDNYMFLARLNEGDNRFDRIARIVNAQSITIPARLEKQDKERRDIAAPNEQA